MSTRTILSFCGTALALLATHAHAQFGSEPAKLEVIKVRDDIYVISNVAVPGLTTALITNDGVLLVDDKFEIDHASIMAALKTVTSEPVKYVINTHYHGDHSGGNAKLQALGTLAVASIEARASMVKANQSGQPNITVGDRAEIIIGGKRVEIHKVGRAHTDGDVVVLFPEQRVLASGDIFANGPGTSAQLVDYPGGGSAKLWPLAVDQALELQFDTVIPGHGLVSTKADLTAYRARAQRFADTLQQLVSQGKS
ncbi:MAG TPA: MBL fold metallo-hydrolase, partial [Gammaproteobacteria bacterium]|nr:MBL fold metallo-hydrolase [Gammaproteobacteria bacterium]